MYAPISAAFFGLLSPAPNAFSISPSINSISAPLTPELNRSSRLIDMLKRSSGRLTSFGKR
jgi:hypothetical protein